MKAILKATGAIVTVECRWVTTIGGNNVLRFIDQKTGYSYAEHQLAILFQEDNNRDPDYWTRLEHQYAGMAMQGILSGDSIMERIAKFKVEDLPSLVTDLSIQLAHALVEKMKEAK